MGDPTPHLGHKRPYIKYTILSQDSRLKILITNFFQAWNVSKNTGHVCCPDEASIQILVNMEFGWKFFMLILIFVKYWIIIECNCYNIITLATCCSCYYPAFINDSTSTKIVLLWIIFKLWPFLSQLDPAGKSTDGFHLYDPVGITSLKIFLRIWVKLVKILKCKSNDIWESSSYCCVSANKSFWRLLLDISSILINRTRF